MSFENFHFLRPWWLLALAALVPLLWRVARESRSSGAWERVCDAELLQHLLVPGGGRGARWPVALIALGWIAGCIALAGPTWERLPQPAYHAPTQTVAVLDLSRAMLDHDVKPSRLARARFKLLDLLDRVDGAVGLVIFAEEPYAVTPLTDDPRVIAEMVPILEPGLMPGRGERLDRAIDKARELLEQAGASPGRIVVLGDGLGTAPDAARDAARRAADEGYTVSALGLGKGADDLETLVRPGGGRYAALSHDDRDIERVLESGADEIGILGMSDSDRASVSADAWRDDGAWILLIPLLLAPLAFRKGWATALAVLLFVGLQAPRAEAASGSLFRRADQQGASAFAEGHHKEAAALFEDPAWRGAASYRAGDYADAIEALQGLDDPGAVYNLGNALAHSGRLDEAISAYDRVIERNPKDEDARYNRDLVKQLLEQQKKKQQQQSGSQGGSDSKSSDASSSSGQGEKQGSGSDDQASKGSQEDGNGRGDQGESKSPSAGANEPEQGSGSDASQGDPSEQSSAAASAGNDSGDDAQANAAPEKGEQGSGSEAAPRSAVAGSEPREQPPADAQAGAASATGDDESPAARAAAAALADSGAGNDAGQEADQHSPGATASVHVPLSESDQATEQWLNRVPDDPGGLLREKLRRRYAEQRYRAQGGMGGPTR
jgi:Ca-activated chloride channel family protein